MNLKKLIKYYMPDGKVKQALRKGYRACVTIKIRYFHANIGLLYSSEDQSFSLVLNNPCFAGGRLTFPYASEKLSLYSAKAILKDMESYFHPIRPDRNALIMDVGAFPGDFTVIASRMLDTGRIIALEPDPKNRDYLEKMLRFNPSNINISVLPYALSDKHGTRCFVQDDFSSAFLSCRKKRSNPRKNLIMVETKTLDSILEEQGAFITDQPLLIKMDIEGAELEAMKGAGKTLAHGATFLIAAYHTINKRPSCEYLKEIFTSNDYSTSIFDNGHLVLVANPRFKNHKLF